MCEPALHRANGAPDAAIADGLASELSMYGSNKLVAVGWTQGGGGVGDGEPLELGRRNGHGGGSEVARLRDQRLGWRPRL